MVAFRSRSMAGCFSIRSTTTTPGREPGRVRARSPWECGAVRLEVSELRVYRDIYYTGSLANTPAVPARDAGRCASGSRRFLRSGRQ